jgi:hypothetical protein
LAGREYHQSMLARITREFVRRGFARRVHRHLTFNLCRRRLADKNASHI